MLGSSFKRLVVSAALLAIVPIVVFGLQSKKADTPPVTTAPSHLGKITDWEGVVSVQPLGEARAALVTSSREVHKGDGIRTGSDGANAAKLRIGNDALLTLGPATQVEIVSTTRVRISGGMIAVLLRNEDSKLELLGADDSKPLVVTGQKKQIVSASANAAELTRVDDEPLWLKGFERTAATSGIGSLVATVGERKVPLSIAAHRVDVQIRDQIARTTITETFANHTTERLEAEFLFPLPADASVSGFAMWIGDELVEADVVEKI